MPVHQRIYSDINSIPPDTGTYSRIRAIAIYDLSISVHTDRLERNIRQDTEKYVNDAYFYYRG